MEIVTYKMDHHVTVEIGMRRAVFSIIGLALLVVLLAACGGEEPPAAAPPAPSVAPPAAVQEEPAPAATEVPVAESDAAPAAMEAMADEDLAMATEESEAEAPAISNPTEAPPATAPATPLPAIDPASLILTPPQGEGPYYPVTEPPERDNDLTTIPGAPEAAAGQVIEFGGRVLSLSGEPLAGAVVEIWQTDLNGVYMHPGDAGTNNRDLNFQFYGESVADEQGVYSFRTIVPGLYEPRPRHIHFKIKLDGRELLTSQLYFAGDERLDLSGIDEAILLRPQTGTDDEGQEILVAEKNLVLSGG